MAVLSFLLMASRPPAETLYTVSIFDGNSRLDILSEPMTVQNRLIESRIWISRNDKVTPSLSSRIDRNTIVRIDRRASAASAIPVNRPADEKLIFSNRIPEGKRVKIFTARNTPYDRDSRRAAAVIGSTSAARDIVLVGIGRKSPKQKIYHLAATAYSPDPRDCWPYSDGITAIGLKAGYGVAAIDPRVIPLGTRIYVEGYGYAIASDLGGAIKGREIDLCFDTHEEAKRFGRRLVKVYLLD